MKVKIGVLILCLVVLWGILSLKSENSSLGKSGILEVNQLVSDPQKHLGDIKVEGVVSFTFPKENLLILIDKKEFKNCGVTTCAILKLPIQWKGAMPHVKDIVLVQGKLQEIDRKFIFVANDVKSKGQGK